MTIDESFDDLYRLLRGSRCASPLLSARTLFDSGKVAESIAELKKIRHTYQESRKNTLATEFDESNPADKESKQLLKRQSKAVDAIGQMDGLVSMLTLQIPQVQKQNTTLPTAAPKSIETHPISSPSDQLDNDLRQKLPLATTDADVRRVLSQHCNLTMVADDHEPYAGERFVIFSNGLGYVVEVDEPPLENNSVRILTWLDRKRMLPIPLSKWNNSASKSKVLKLEPFDREAVTTIAVPTIPAPKFSLKLPGTDRSGENSDTAERDKILDVGAFSQLLDAAQRSGIVPGSGVIIQVRDCEFRLGRFNKGLQMMETLYTTFIGAESQRNQRLQREEAEIASGRKKISPKDLLAKRAQDNQTTQVVDRTKVRFQRVLEGLRGLLPLEKASNEMD
ncbi:MAG: hypothetical protein NTU79_17550 [Planctomycetota bacterium]|nr:hypothetical protein [Planctomycetota bacterium]